MKTKNLVGGKKKKAKNSSIENRQKQGQSKHYETLA